MIKKRLSMVLLSGVLVLTGCQRPTHGPSPEAASPDPMIPPSSTNNSLLRIGPERPAVLLDGDDPGDLISLKWIFVALRDGGRRIVLLQPSEHDSCAPSVGVVLKQTDAYVEISVMGKQVGPVCSAEYTLPETRFVELSKPLGDRDLLHAPVTR